MDPCRDRSYETRGSKSHWRDARHSRHPYRRRANVTSAFATMKIHSVWVACQRRTPCRASDTLRCRALFQLCSQPISAVPCPPHPQIAEEPAPGNSRRGSSPANRGKSSTRATPRLFCGATSSTSDQPKSHRSSRRCIIRLLTSALNHHLLPCPSKQF